MRAIYMHVVCDRCPTNYGALEDKKSVSINLKDAILDYEDEYVDAELIARGWTVTFNEDICPDCAKGEYR